MTRDITLHPEHGINPTIPMCLYCGKEKNEIALLGAAYKGEAPMHMVLDDVPCEACQADFAKGIALFEHNGKHRTGRVIVVRESWLDAAVTDPVLRERMRAQRAALMTVEDFNTIQAGIKASEGEE